MMPPADRIYDPGQEAKKDLTDTVDDFLAIGPVSRAQVTGRAEFTSEQLRMREINTVNIRC